MFPESWPGAGLLLLRATAAIPLLRDCTTALLTSSSPVLITSEAAALTIAAFVLAGFFTPVAAALLGVAQICMVLLPGQDPWSHITLASLCFALAMLGPGAWSIDARIFGRKRVRLP
jgi:uncharacterized membrane protein YphA (DoxX/SURF4 family)